MSCDNFKLHSRFYFSYNDSDYDSKRYVCRCRLPIKMYANDIGDIVVDESDSDSDNGHVIGNGNDDVDFNEYTNICICFCNN